MNSVTDLLEITGLALVITLSPVPVTGQLLLVLNNRKQWTSAAFATGWAIALLIVCGLAATGAALLLPRIFDVDWRELAPITLLVGIGLVVGGVVLWRRPANATDAAPSRISRIFTGLGPAQGLFIGFGYGALRPKNFLTAIAAGLLIGANSSLWGGVALVLYFTILASASLAAPVLVYVLGGNRTRDGMHRLQQFLTRHGNRITGAALAVIGLIVGGFGLLRLVA
ncbi:GAP family protein [Mycetocola zhadangensis]|uniref:GAP family protein n=1 Tax=Mycetocola zhadangensis TaxID=1164595 RepID=A0A3L7ISQ6_9MICO|nr:GAP family protein [Mycetocola zhadangensis]RLQ81179.1 hypothetical protein D9V28_15700 [Mycetocola zhadangensis]GGF05424.1 hypothetical protein GCM10011313_30720 [Mycetocola zhadangensis]